MAGFSVYQPALGAQLQWLPALGTPELDEMIHALIPGSASIQEKRAAVSVNFFAFAEQTGQNFKYYPVSVSPAPATVPSPAKSAGLYDSAYSSSFNASPVISSMSPWPQSPATFVSSFDEPKPASRAPPSKKPSTSSSRQTAVDFANHPGMRILTKDGRDVTNSASRGCKTKEQRDHAHLMRIIKACDACKRKKVRCDPSHRKRTASSSSASQSDPKATKKIKKKAAEIPPAPPIIMPDLFSSFIFDTPEAASSSSSFESSPETIDDLWTQFVAFDQEPMSLVNNFTIDDYSFLNDPQSLPTPDSIESSSSPSQWFTSPYTPAPPGPSPPVIISESLSSELVSPRALSVDVQQDDLMAPYLNPGVPHGTNYADFRLFSPPRDFFLDEEPLPAKKALMSGRNQQQSPQTSAVSTLSPAEISASPDSGAFASSDGYYSSPYIGSSAGDTSSASGRLDESVHSPPALVYSPLGGGVRATVSANVNGIPGHGAQGQRQSSAAYHTSRLRTPASSLSTDEPCAPQSQAKSVVPTSSQQSPSSPTHSSLAYHRSPSCYEGATQVSRSYAPCQSHVLSRPGVIRLCSTKPSPTSVAAQSSAAGAISQLIIQSKVEASPVPGERPGAGVYSVGSGAQPVTVLATALVATLPIQHLLGGGCMKPGQPSSGILFQFAVLGLVSSLLAVALQTQSLGSETDSLVIVNLIIIASMSLASVMYRGWRLPDTSSPEPVGMPATIDNVKTKIQDVGRQVGGLSCAVSRHMRALIPRLPSLSTVKF